MLIIYWVVISELTSRTIAKGSEKRQKRRSKLNVYFLIFPPGFVPPVHPITRYRDGVPKAPSAQDAPR